MIFVQQWVESMEASGAISKEDIAAAINARPLKTRAMTVQKALEGTGVDYAGAKGVSDHT